MRRTQIAMPADPSRATFVRRFVPPFAELVRSGAKLQTVCKPPRRTPKPGDLLILRTWEGPIYADQIQRLLRRATIVSVSPIELPPGPDHPEINDAFARAEGFNNLKHLLLHFKPTHRLLNLDLLQPITGHK